ncbi:hypothetical protein CCYS_13610 [Corynebacterium cystitidis DSM 20524]|uniref:Transposase for insertion sequence element IS21-like C-terminal domain-containing protein n=1 Tax=Corynebacterium cystitidis DSM 20524 TaxID=1121357 RepID=A0A1H9WQ45_9CORY|nr:hypothetical protein CCYS_13610 [Corynebacterium cystitidis DSM 20524]SES36066.1 hypothetical protein SAMN05661109_02851 [Corynebacterium cystitidis DSM 20524]SNV91777.1 transposase [Corynebacterium cystitidis]
MDIIQDWLGQYLAPYVFDTLDDLNAAVAEQVDWINHHKTPYRGVDGLTRYQEFCDYEQQALKPLPAFAYESVQWRWATPRPNCHFQVDKRFYSIPSVWVGSRLRIGLGQDSVKVYDPDGVELIYVHQRSYKRPGSYTSIEEHQPDSAMTDGKLWTRSRYETWSRNIGPATYKAITVMIEREQFPTQAFLSCENTLHLASRYSRQQLEDACAFVIGSKQFISYSSIKRAISATSRQSNRPSTSSSPNAPRSEVIPTVTSFDQAALRGFDSFNIPTPTRKDSK